MRRALPLAGLALLAAACTEQAPAPTAPDANAPPPVAEARAQLQEADFVPGRVLVRFEPGADAPGLANRAGGSIDRVLSVGTHVLNVPEGAEARVVAALNRNPNVVYAEADRIYTFGDPTVIPLNDPFIGYKWDLDNDGNIYASDGTVELSTGAADADMDWLEAYEALGPDGPGSAVIGILDTGIRRDHEDLQGRIAVEYDFFDGDADATDDNGHGTHVAGIAGASPNNGVGVAGVAFGSDIQFAIGKVCGQSSGRGPFSSYGCPSSAIAEGIVWAADNGAAVVNMSLGGGSGSTTTRDALVYARNAGTLPVCAAGNDAGPVSYPGAWPECVAVSSTDWSDGLASYSNFGPEVELSAPGGDDEDTQTGRSYILSSYFDGTGSYAFLAGTSMAAPQVAGLAGLLHALGVTDPEEKLTRMKSTADDLGAAGSDDLFGVGRINVFAAVDGLGGGSGGGGDTNSAPTASFTFSCTDLSCSFDGSGSSDSDGSLVGYDWAFGDGATASGTTASHTYAAGGTYTVTLTVTDDAGATGSDSQGVTVSETVANQPPTASFTFSCTDLGCSFDGSGSSDGDGSIASYDWTFGDGATGSGVSASHTYAAGGTYTVTLTVTDDAGATDTSSQDVTVTEPVTGGIALSATGTKVRGRHSVDLSWSGAGSASVDIYRDGAVIATTANDGAYTDATNNRGGATYTYQVCEAGTTTCSNTVTVVF